MKRFLPLLIICGVISCGCTTQTTYGSHMMLDNNSTINSFTAPKGNLYNGGSIYNNTSSNCFDCNDKK